MVNPRCGYPIHLSIKVEFDEYFIRGDKATAFTEFHLAILRRKDSNTFPSPREKLNSPLLAKAPLHKRCMLIGQPKYNLSNHVLYCTSRRVDVGPPPSVFSAFLAAVKIPSIHIS